MTKYFAVAAAAALIGAVTAAAVIAAVSPAEAGRNVIVHQWMCY